MCGIIGISGSEEVFEELVYSLTALQHRGQDTAGIVTLSDFFHVRKGEGLAAEVFFVKDKERLPGETGLGHIRYASHGRNDVADAQPFTVYYPFGLAMVHNGNVTNFEEIKRSMALEHHRLLYSTNDSELILYMLAVELEKKNLKNFSVEDLFSCVYSIQKKVEGAYAVITLIANRGMLAFMDPNGIRPLILGKKKSDKGISYAFASESSCFDYLGYELVHNLQPGEAIFIDKDKNVHSKVCHCKRSAFCVFEYIYFAKEDSIIHGKLTANERERMGRALANRLIEKEIKPDIVIDVPSAAYFCAQGLADALKIPYRRGLVKNNSTRRSFISSTQKLRETIVRYKLNPIKSVIDGKHVVIVDDSVVRGTTSKYIVQQVRKAGAREITFASASPPLKYPCVYGIDMSRKKEMIAARLSTEEIRKYIGADSLIYPTVEDFRELYKGKGYCDACFSGDYPTEISREVFLSIEREKVDAQR